MKINSHQSLESFLLKNFTKLKILVFISDSIPSCQTFESTLLENTQNFSSKNIEVGIIKDDFDNYEDIFNEYSIEFVPTSVILNANFSALEKLQNVSPGELLTQAEKSLKTFQQSLELESIKYKQTLSRVLNDNLFILFEFLSDRLSEYQTAKHLLEEKQLAVRRQSTMPFKEDRITVILAHLGNYFYNDYSHFANNNLPLVYFNKELLFELKQIEQNLIKNKELIDTLQQTEENNVKSIISSNKVLLFVNADDVNYKEQEDILKCLQKRKVMFTYLDISTKPAIKKILSKILLIDNLNLSILLVDGKHVYQHQELMLKKDSGFEGLVPKEYVVESVDDRIRMILKSAPVVVFIKGTPEFPQCGFTRQVIELMKVHGVQFGYYNILSDAELRERLRTYSNWETYPQIYVNEELIGGLDIVREMIENGQFEDAFKVGKTKNE